MRLNLNLNYLFLFFYIIAGSPKICFGQVLAGIQANNIVRNNGDTINICQGGAILYQSVAQGGGTLSWRFGSGNPSTSSLPGPFSVNYPVAGFEVAFQKVVSGNFVDSAYVVVRVSNEKPVSAFSFSPASIECANIPIQFSSTSTGSSLTYSWDFKDGTTSTLQNPSHQFLKAVGNAGTQQIYPVTLTVTNIYGCSIVSTQNVTVKKVPDAALGSGNLVTDVQYVDDYGGLPTFKRCQPDNQFNFIFTNGSTTKAFNIDYAIQWEENIAFQPVATFPVTHSYATGNHKLTFRVTGPDGCIGLRTYNVFLGTTPQGLLGGPLSNFLCVKDVFQIPVLGTEVNPPGTSYEFSVNDNSPVRFLTPPIGSFISHPTTISSCGYSGNGFIATLKITNACATIPLELHAQPLYVSGLPKASIRTTPATNNVCTSKPVLLESTSAFGQVVSSTGTCTNTGKQVWVISPSTGFTTLSGSMGKLNGVPGDGSAWDNGTPALQVSFSVAAIYTIKLYISNTRCGLDSSTKTICVRNPPQADFALPQKSSCGPTSLMILNTSPKTNECEGDEYSWAVKYSDPLNCNTLPTTPYSFTNGTSASSVSPGIQFQVPGRYIIELTVKAKNSNIECNATRSDTFFVKGPPKAAINPTAAVCLGNKILAATNTAACYTSLVPTYQWTFAGGMPASSSTKIPDSISYPAAGTYPVQLTVTDPECNLLSTTNTTVIISPAPTARAGNDTIICGKQTLVIGMQRVPGVSYQWTPATGLSSGTAPNPTVVLVYKGTSADTTYTFKLRAFVGVNCAAEDSINITVKRSPVITISPLNPEICAGDSIQVIAEGADNYNWLPAISITNGNTSSPIAKPGITTRYTVTGTLANSCSDTASVSVKVNPGAKAQFSLSDNVRCTGTNLNTVVKLVASTVANTSYNWFVNNILVASNTSGIFPSYPLNIPGVTVTIKLVVTSPGGCKPDSMQLPLGVAQAVTAKFTRDPSTACGTLKVAFTNTSSVLNNINFIWNFGNGQSVTAAQPPSITFNSSPSFSDTTYYIVLKAYNGCDTTYWRDSVKVQAPAKARFGVDATQACSPFTGIFYNTSPGNNTAYYWDFGDGSRDTTHTKLPLSHQYVTGLITTYHVQLIAENSCSRDTQNINLVVIPNTIKPQIAVNGNQLYGCVSHTATFINNSTGAAQLIWNFGDGTTTVTTSNSQNYVPHTFNNTGTFRISIRLFNDCADTTIFRQVTVYSAPIARFNMDSLACTGNQVKTINTSNGDAYEWLWGDGSSSADLNGVHTYASNNNYSVKLVAKRLNNTGVVCADTTQKQVRIINKVPARIIVAAGRTCAPYLVKVAADGAGTDSQVSWLFSDSSRSPGIFPASGTEASYQYLKPGSYSVKMIITNAAGCSDSATQEIVVTPSLKVTFASPSIITCNTDTTIGFIANVQNSAGGPVNYKWFINGQLSGNSNPFTYRFQDVTGNTTASIFNIRVLAENGAGCGDTSSPVTLTIQPLVKPAIKVLPGLVQSQPDYNFTFSDTSIASLNKTWNWDFGDRTRQQRSGRQVSYTYGDTGTYLVRLTVSDFATFCAAKDSVKVTILYQPGYLQVPNAICPGCATFALRSFLPMGRGLSKYHLLIYNKTGTKIFETTSLDANGAPNEGWDARFAGHVQMQDAYQWIIEARYINGTEWKGMKYPNTNNYIKTGFITVVK